MSYFFRAREDDREAGMFLSPIVFGFTAATQFDSVSDDPGSIPPDGRRYAHDVAARLTKDVQEKPRIAGVACRNRSYCATLVALPVAHTESATGRHGLVAVLGVVASRRPEVATALVAPAFDVVAETLTSVFRGRTLQGSAEAMTHALQGSGVDADPVVELRRQVSAWTDCLTFLAVHGDHRAASSRPAAPSSTEPAVVLAHMLHAQLLRTGDDQMGSVATVDSFRRYVRPGRVSDHLLAGREVYVCQSTSL